MPQIRVRRASGTKRTKSHAWIPLHALLESLGLPGAVSEYPNAVPGRKFRIDAAWGFPYFVGVEQQGGVWSMGKHGRGSGVVKDYERQNLLQINGWIILQFTPQQLWGGYATDQIRLALMSRGWKP